MNYFANLSRGISSNLTSFRIVCLAGLIALGFSVPSMAQAPSSCVGGSSITGSFGLYAAGVNQTGVLKFLTGSVKFDGACGLAAYITVNENGATTPAFAATTGSYAANGDGTISLSFIVPGSTQTESYTVAYSPLFNEAIGNETDSSAAATIDLKAQGSVNSFNDTSLKGTFAGSGSSTDAFIMTFDGNGNITGTNYSAKSGRVPFTGTYFVLSDGSIGGYFTIGTTNLAFGGVIDNNSNEAQFVINSAFNGWVPLEGFVIKRIK